jgi:signal transduction histidine kinase
LYINAMPLPVGVAFSPNPRQARAVVTFADITAHRQAEESMRSGHRLEMVGRLASGIVHDFNNLLTVMLGLAEMARGNLSPEHAAREDLGRLLEVGEHARALAGQLLAFSKQRRPSAQAIDVNVVVVHALKMLHSTLPPSIQVEKQLAGADLFVQADETQLKQIIVNLCLNAREAMGQSGRITVKTECAAPPSSNGTSNGVGTPHAALHAGPSAKGANGNGNGANGWVRLSVQDTGAGMEETVQARIFEPFFTTKERGTGLGLAVVRQIVEDFGGRIQVWSKPQEGTRMDIWLRASPPPDSGH